MRSKSLLTPPVRKLLRLAIQEDVGPGDVTTYYFASPTSRLRGYIVAKEAGILCGLRIAQEVFRQITPRVRFTHLARDGQKIRPGQKVACVSGSRELLTAERVALNFLQRLSGIATLTRSYVDRLRGSRAQLYDTRKTLPGWRSLDKYAVRCGGGTNHRMGLHDAAMIKDNHLNVLDPTEILGGIRRFKRKHPKIPIIVESKNRLDTELALALGADIILLDNMPPSRLKDEIRLIRFQNAKTQIEVSGGVSLGNIRPIARLGPDRISVGRITHSAPALDFSLEIESTSFPHSQASASTAVLGSMFPRARKRESRKRGVT